MKLSLWTSQMFWTVPCHTCGVVLQLFYTSRKTINKSNSVGSAYLKISSLLPPWKMNAEQITKCLARRDFKTQIHVKIITFFLNTFIRNAASSKMMGGHGSNMARIICPLGPNRVNWYPKTWGGTCPPGPPTSGVSVFPNLLWEKNEKIFSYPCQSTW